MRRALCLAAMLLAAASAAWAERIVNPIAVFSGLDKITGQTTTFEIGIDEEKRFGRLLVKPRVCYSRPPTEEPKTTSFVEVREIEPDNKAKPVFTGWMFAESPGLNAVEHAVFDVWLTGCRDPKAAPPQVEVPTEVTPTPEGQEEPDD